MSTPAGLNTIFTNTILANTTKPIIHFETFNTFLCIRKYIVDNIKRQHQKQTYRIPLKKSIFIN